MSMRAVVVAALVGLLRAPALYAQVPPEVRLVFHDQGKCHKVSVHPSPLPVDLDLYQTGRFYWQVDYYCASPKALYVDADFNGQYQACTFCELKLPALSGHVRVENSVPLSAGEGFYSYRIRLCDPNSMNNCVEDDPEVEVRRPPRYLDDTVRVVLTERGGRCQAEAPPELRSTRAHAAVTWKIHNGCRQTVRASVSSMAQAGTSGCSRDVDVPAGRTGRVACVLTGDQKEEMKFELVLDKHKPEHLGQFPLTVKVDKTQ